MEFRNWGWRQEQNHVAKLCALQSGESAEDADMRLEGFLVSSRSNVEVPVSNEGAH